MTVSEAETCPLGGVLSQDYQPSATRTMKNDLARTPLCGGFHAFARLVLILLIVARFSSGSADAAETADFYVSPDGSDGWSGTAASPNADRTDGPFATLQRARDAVRTIEASKEDGVLVQIRGGTYLLSQTVVFGLDDGGAGHKTVTYAAFPGEEPVFSSGQKIMEWKRASEANTRIHPKAVGKVRVADVSDQFHALFDAKGLLPRSRSKGFIPLDGGSRNSVRSPPGILKNYPNIEDVEIVVRPHHAWIVNILPLVSVDAKRQVARTSLDATYVMNRLHFLKQTESCWVENTIDEIDRPGEWALDTQNDKLYLWPRNDSPVVAPQLTELIRVEGKVDMNGPTDTPVRNLVFRGLTFMHGDRYTISKDDAGLQHDWEMHDKPSALVRMRGVENCVIDDCRFAHSGSGAIRVDLHGQQNQIKNNLIEQIGGTGVLLCGYGPGTKDVNRDNVIDNNHIRDIGQIYSHSPGIMLWQSGENRVANNLIHHTPYTAIIVSGCMADFFRRSGRELTRTIRRHEITGLPRRPQRTDVLPYLHTHDNIIEANEIHHAMEELGDGNAIYVRGAGVGNVIRRNYIHHLVTPMIMQAAIRTDGGQTGTLIAENVIYKCTSQGIILKLDNRCENNIVFDVIAPPRGYYLSLREGPLTGAVIKRNVFYSSTTACTFIDELPPGRGRVSEDRRGRTIAKASQADTDRNIYFCVDDPELGKQTLVNQQAGGVDVNSLATDPMFIDPIKGDFRFRAGSPAIELGIMPIDLSNVGLRDR